MVKTIRALMGLALVAALLPQHHTAAQKWNDWTMIVQWSSQGDRLAVGYASGRIEILAGPLFSSPITEIEVPGGGWATDIEWSPDQPNCCLRRRIPASI